MLETIQHAMYNSARSLDTFDLSQGILVGFCLVVAVLAVATAIRATR